MCPGALQEEEVQQQQRQLQEDRQELHRKKDEYQKDLERLRDAQRKLDRDKEAVQRQFDKLGDARPSEVSVAPLLVSCHLPGCLPEKRWRCSFLHPSFLPMQRTPSTTSDESQFPGSSQSLELDPLEPPRSKPKGRGLNPFSSSSTTPSLKASEGTNQMSKGLLQLAKNKSKEGKKKKKSKGGSAQTAGKGCWKRC